MLILLLPSLLIIISVIASALILKNSWQVTPTAGEILTLESRLQHFYHRFALFFKQLGHYLYFYWLILMRQIVVVFKVILTLFEKKFSRLIESVHGKGVITKRGSASLFLSSISKK